MTASDLPVEGLRPWPGTSDQQFDSAGLTEAHRDSGRASRLEADVLGCFGRRAGRHTGMRSSSASAGAGNRSEPAAASSRAR
jgi:hypothetical protein